MTREPVSSSTIAKIAYDPESELLEVEFCPGKNGIAPVWQYAAVPPHIAAEVIDADSIGRAFSAQIKKGGYVARRVANVDAAGIEHPVEATA